jgi:hypothetical protein
MGIVFMEFLGLVFLVALGLGFVTQVLIPFARGTPFFPHLRKNTPMKEKVLAAQHELEEQTELADLQEQLNEINRRKAQLGEKE